MGSVSCAAILNRHWKVVFLFDSWTNKLCSAWNRFAADFIKRSSLLWMRGSRGRGRPPGCGRHHQGVAGQGNISGLNQITYTDWEDQTFSRNLISGWLGQLKSSTWPSLSCYLTSALGSPSSSAPLQVHLWRGDLPLNTLVYCIALLISYLLIPCTPWLKCFDFMDRRVEPVLAQNTKK